MHEKLVKGSFHPPTHTTWGPVSQPSECNPYPWCQDNADSVRLHGHPQAYCFLHAHSQIKLPSGSCRFAPFLIPSTTRAFPYLGDSCRKPATAHHPGTGGLHHLGEGGWCSNELACQLQDTEKGYANSTLQKLNIPLLQNGDNSSWSPATPYISQLAGCLHWHGGDPQAQIAPNHYCPAFIYLSTLTSNPNPGYLLHTPQMFQK